MLSFTINKQRGAFSGAYELQNTAGFVDTPTLWDRLSSPVKLKLTHYRRVYVSRKNERTSSRPAQRGVMTFKHLRGRGGWPKELFATK